MGKNYWMVTISLENFQISKQMNFKVQGFKASFRKRAQRMQPEDRVLYYIEGIQKFGATATLTSAYFEDHKPIWKSHNGRDDYPHRVNLELNYILKEEDLIDASQIGPRLDYVKRWAPEKWPLAFQGSLHLLPKKDFSLIEGEMKRLTKGPGGRRRRNRSSDGAA